MDITVHFETQLRYAMGTEPITVSLPDKCCMREALQLLAKQFGPLVAERIVASDGMPQRSLLVFVNDQLIRHDLAANHPLKHGDVLLLYPPISGG